MLLEASSGIWGEGIIRHPPNFFLILGGIFSGPISLWSLEVPYPKKLKAGTIFNVFTYDAVLSRDWNFPDDAQRDFSIMRVDPYVRPSGANIFFFVNLDMLELSHRF